jgi:putative transposase
VRAARGEERAFDGFKKVMGRKRNILVDTLGIILACNVHAADQQEGITGKEILDELPKPLHDNLKKIVADNAYRRGFLEYAEVYHQIEVQINDQRVTGTNMKPWRWIVERTFAWLNHYRRMSRDYEQKVKNSESMLYISMLPILLHRITA